MTGVQTCALPIFKLKGTAALETLPVKMSEEYALCPDDFCGVKPKPVVKEGDEVKVGDALFVDKLHPEVKFVSPVSGVVSQIERGDRRKLLSIRVKADGKQTAHKFEVKGDVKALMLESGLFGMMLQRPYAVVPNPEDKPKSLFVSAFNSMPLAQNFEYVLRSCRQCGCANQPYRSGEQRRSGLDDGSRGGHHVGPFAEE